MSTTPGQPDVQQPAARPKRPSLRERLTWSAGQRSVLIALLAALVVFSAIRLIYRPTFVADPQPERPAGFDELQDRIDPNTADAATLSALPSIGPKRAEQIIAHREAWSAAHNGEPAFQKLSDLKRIKGIGDAITAHLEPFLIFPAPAPATQESP